MSACLRPIIYNVWMTNRHLMFHWNFNHPLGFTFYLYGALNMCYYAGSLMEYTIPSVNYIDPVVIEGVSVAQCAKALR